MRVDELMIGDWVYSAFSDIPCKVQLLELRESGYGSVKTTNVDGLKDIASLSPIPLTPEILEKNFYKKCVITNGMEIDIRFKPYHITEQLYVHNGMCGTMVCCSDGGNTLSPLFECKYVHQLQHILKASGILNEIML